MGKNFIANQVKMSWKNRALITMANNHIRLTESVGKKKNVRYCLLARKLKSAIFLKSTYREFTVNAFLSETILILLPT